MLQEENMPFLGIVQILVFFALVLLATKPLGSYMARVFEGERTILTPVLRPVERLLYALFRINEQEDMRWTTYSFALLAFSMVGGLVTFAMLRLQGYLPLNPQHHGAAQMTPDLSFNTAISFMTNTNWQSYSPELTVSYFSNMVALAMHNWMSAAAGVAVAIALVRGFARDSVSGLGSFWVDVTRAMLYVLLPICLIYAVFLVWQGVPQNLSPYAQATTMEGARQSIAQGPVASQEAIKMLGVNGGGFFNANSAHPYENPTPLTNMVEMLSIFLIPAALTYTFGKMVGNTRQGWAIFAAMTMLFATGVGICYRAESAGNPNIVRLGVTPSGNMEGKETRFGITASALFATITTDASCGAVNAMHDSLTPVGGAVAMVNMMCDETIFGGVGAGLYGMLMYAVIAVFIAGLMVGRTPEYLGKKIEKFEVRMAILALLILFATAVFLTAIASNVAYDKVNNQGAHGFSEILYAYLSGVGNNGSAFAGLSANNPIYNTTIGMAMLSGRFLMIIPLLAMAGSLVRKKKAPVSAGTLATDRPTFVVLLAGMVLIVGALEYFPALALGPIVDQLHMAAGRLF